METQAEPAAPRGRVARARPRTPGWPPARGLVAGWRCATRARRAPSSRPRARAWPAYQGV